MTMLLKNENISRDEAEDMVRESFAHIAKGRPNSMLCVIIGVELKDMVARHHPCQSAREALEAYTGDAPYVVLMSSDSRPDSSTAITDIYTHDRESVAHFVNGTRAGADATDASGIAWLALARQPFMQIALLAALGREDDADKLEQLVREKMQQRQQKQTLH